MPFFVIALRMDSDRWWRILVAIVGSLGVIVACQAEVITRLPTRDKVLALTFDGCETLTPSYVDEAIADYLVREKIPFTLFVSGHFAQRNRERLAELAALPFVELENHSYSHPLHMERLNKARQQGEVQENESWLASISPVKPRFFRFPGGHHDAAALKTVESLGYRVVHWSFASGDPDPKLSVERLFQWVTNGARPGAILVFHINGRGYRTGAALPRIVAQLRQQGYRFIRLDELL